MTDSIKINGKYTVMLNAQVNAYRPYIVINTETDKVEFRSATLGVCLDYISDRLAS